ncbi:MAG: hypothetical protein U9R58_04725 [Chloroflexota bacterium]|nr:hypothetical protein [Chloroflexota bacterium]
MSNLGPPPEDVLHAFGATERPTHIAGGQGQAYRSGHIILKPAKDDEETNWIAEFYLAVDCDGFRLPKPIRTNSGCFVYGGWQAWEYIEGQHKRERWNETIEVCIRFHQAIADFSQPTYFNRREQNPWVVADKVAWGEMEIEHHPRIAPVVEQLRQCLHTVNEKSQLIHGDFGGNVLFSDDLSPAIIDFSPYWRPVEFAVGVMIADAIVWEGADKSLMIAGFKYDNFCQHLARAELRRVVELETLHQMYGWEILDQIEAHLPLINAICKRCS